MALRKVLLRHQRTLEYRILRWKFEQNFVPKPRENWMQKVTLPSSLGKSFIFYITFTKYLMNDIKDVN